VHVALSEDGRQPTYQKRLDGPDGLGDSRIFERDMEERKQRRSERSYPALRNERNSQVDQASRLLLHSGRSVRLVRRAVHATGVYDEYIDGSRDEGMHGAHECKK